MVGQNDLNLVTEGRGMEKAVKFQRRREGLSSLEIPNVKRYPGSKFGAKNQVNNTLVRLSTKFVFSIYGRALHLCLINI